MTRMMKLCLLSLMAVGLCASVGQASVSDVSVLGNGSLTMAGSNSGIRLLGDGNIAFTWADIEADDVDIDADATTASATMSQTWELKDWLYSPDSWRTTVTANLTVDELLDTENLGDLASDDILITFELFGASGSTLIDSDQFAVANSVQDGTDLGPTSTPVALSVTTPSSPVDGTNHGFLKLTVSAMASAFTAATCPPDDGSGDDGGNGDNGGTGDDGCPTPVVPAPGAIMLASLGMGLVSWLRTRRTL